MARRLTLKSLPLMGEAPFKTPLMLVIGILTHFIITHQIIPSYMSIQGDMDLKEILR